MQNTKAKYKNTEIGLIPEDWEIRKLSDITTLITKGTTPKQFTKNGIIYVKIESLQGNGINLDKCLFIDETTHKTILNRSVLESDDLLFAIAGATIGKCTIVPKELLPANTNQALAIIRLKEKEIINYIFYFLKSALMQKYIIDNIAGGAQPNLNLGQISRFTFPIPSSLTEQKAIATALSDTDALISSLEQLISKKRAIKQGAMQELLKPKDGWEVKKLGEIVTFLKGKGLPKSDLKVDGKYRCIHYGELFTKYNERITNILSYTDYNSNCFYSQANDILMPTSDVTPYGLATASCVKEDNIILGGDILVIRPISGNLDGLYLAYYISQNKRRIMKLVTGSTVYHLYGSSLNDFKLNYPDIKEQIRITSIISNMDTEIENLEQKLHKYKQIKQGMMQQLLTGKIRLV